jgi:hypothetical protein
MELVKLIKSLMMTLDCSWETALSLLLQQPETRRKIAEMLLNYPINP